MKKYLLCGLITLGIGFNIFGCTAVQEEPAASSGDAAVKTEAADHETVSNTDDIVSDANIEEAAKEEPKTPLEIFLSIPRDEEGIIIGSAEFAEPIEMIVAANGVNMRDAPSIDGSRISVFSLGQRLSAHSIADGWVQVTVLPGMQEGYIRSDLVTLYDENTVYYAHDVRQEVEIIKEDGTVEIQVSNLVDANRYVNGMENYIVFATPDNYTGETLYIRDICLLEIGTAQKLAAAQELFLQDGYSIKIYDGYRPSSVSAIIFDFVGDGTYAAGYGKSMHNRGAAVDITLVDSAGNELEMPSGVMELNEKAHRDNPEMTEAAKANMDYMTGIMESCGFMPYSKEWWHFTDTDYSKYPPTDLDLSAVYFEALKK